MLTRFSHLARLLLLKLMRLFFLDVVGSLIDYRHGLVAIVLMSLMLALSFGQRCLLFQCNLSVGQVLSFMKIFELFKFFLFLVLTIIF